LVFQGFAIQPAPAAQAVNVKYIHDYIQQKHGVTVQINASNPLQIANVKYLLCAVDKTNSLCSTTTTNYCNHELATQQVVDTVATIDAVDRLIQCGIASATAPTSCVSRTSHSSDNEDIVSGCTNGDVGGVSVTTFVVGGYCTPTQGSGRITTPVVQSCSDCSPATNASGMYCYCKIHSINGKAVAPSARYVYHSGDGPPSGCRGNCTNSCADYAQNNATSRAALFSALGN
jgi:hypothetical protein